MIAAADVARFAEDAGFGSENETDPLPVVAPDAVARITGASITEGLGPLCEEL